MKRVTSIVLAVVLVLVSSAMALAAPQQAQQQGLSEQGTAIRDRVSEQLEQQLRTRLEDYPEISQGKLSEADRTRIMEQLRLFAEEQLRTQLAAEQGDDATKSQVQTQLQTQLQKMVRDQLNACVKDQTMTQIKARIAEKKQFRVHLETGEYQFKNNGAIRAAGQTVKFDVPPVIKDGRTLVPVRALTEALGAQVDYDEATNSVTVTLGDTVIVLIIGDNVIYVNGEQVTLDTQSANVDGRAVLPLRAIVENLGGQITYDDATGDVDVTMPVDSTTGE